MIIIDISTKIECTNCDRKPNTEITIGNTKIDLCCDCAKILYCMLNDEFEEDYEFDE